MNEWETCIDEWAERLRVSRQETADAQATIADLHGQVKAAQAQHEDMVTRNKILRDRPDLPPDRAEWHDRFVKLQQRVAQLEGENAKWEASCNLVEAVMERNKLKTELTTLQADHATLLGLVRKFSNHWPKQIHCHESAGNWSLSGIPITFWKYEDAKAFLDLLNMLDTASLPAQPAQGGAKCVWVDDEGGIYQTGCKHAFMVDPDSDEPPIWIKFCCYCGSLVEFFVPAAEGETRA